MLADNALNANLQKMDKSQYWQKMDKSQYYFFNLHSIALTSPDVRECVHAMEYLYPENEVLGVYRSHPADWLGEWVGVWHI